MFRVSLFAFLSVGALARNGCDINATNNGCVNATSFFCVNKCQEFASEEACQTVSGCTWRSEDIWCSPNGLDNCFDKDINSCTGDCVVDERSCHLVNACQGPEEAACDREIIRNNNASQCTALNSSCSWAPLLCDAVQDRCEVATSQSACTGMAGCFWAVSDSTIRGARDECVSCFEDSAKIFNVYTGAKNIEGQTCTGEAIMNGDVTMIYTRIFSAVASASGCSGGTPKSSPYNLTCTYDVSNSTTGNSTTGGGNSTTGGGNSTTGGGNSTTGGSNSTTGGSNSTTGGSNSTTVGGATSLVFGMGVCFTVITGLFL